MKKAQFKIRKILRGEVSEEIKDGYIFDYDYLGLLVTLTMHKVGKKHYPFWVISEYSTGMSICGGKTRKNALEQLEVVKNHIRGKDVIEQAINSALIKYGRLN